MSLVRRWPGRSDVYIYLDTCGALQCNVCALRAGASFYADTAAEMAEHVKQHREAGHLVPERVLASLTEDAAAWDADIRESRVEFEREHKT